MIDQEKQALGYQAAPCGEGFAAPLSGQSATHASELPARLSAPAAWQESTCRAPMWMGGSPAGLCGEPAFGHQLPERYLRDTRGWGIAPYCFGHACVNHGGPTQDEPRIFQDGLTEEGRPMWCAVMPDFINLQESPAGFDGNPMQAAASLRAAINRAQEQS